MQIGGYQGKARLTFDSIRVSERYQDAQSEQMETTTKIMQINQGWTTNDEAAIEMVGHEAVDEPKQINSGNNSGNNKQDDQEEEQNDEEKQEEERSSKVYQLKKKEMIRG